MFMPSYMLRKVIPDCVSRTQYRNGMGIATVILTGICFIYPELNHSALHLFALPCVGMTLSHVSKKYEIDIVWKTHNLIFLETKNIKSNGSKTGGYFYGLVCYWFPGMAGWSPSMWLSDSFSLFALLLACFCLFRLDKMLFEIREIDLF